MDSRPSPSQGQVLHGNDIWSAGDRGCGRPGWIPAPRLRRDRFCTGMTFGVRETGDGVFPTRFEYNPPTINKYNLEVFK
jgi:hypothetical protein